MATTTPNDQPLFGGPLTSTTPTQTLHTTSSDTRGLFPTQTRQSNNDNNNKAGSPNVYYLVFLGILVVLLVLAGCLALRAIRMRRRYRTATQIALSRGDPLPVFPNSGTLDNYWGITAFDRLSGFQNDQNQRRREREADKAKLKLKPRIYDNLVYNYKDAKSGDYDDDRGNVLNSIEPISLQSLLPMSTTNVNTPHSSNPYSPYFQNPNEQTSARPLFGFHRQRSPPVNLSHQQYQQQQQQPEMKESDRALIPNEPIQMGVIIRMPTEVDNKQKQKSEWDDEEEVGWELGMELGIWQGHIYDPQHNQRTNYQEQDAEQRKLRESIETDDEIYR
ncbi:uncharacterized protein L201_007409 [Kwoniella dendrophila CBS 6074]|uniref:Uncharacterized protein n=1 Tax=Kwoniella dendrophila CBS 6074 TaxID=1295534 RepID=A0AAX4K4B7_9TREE